MSLISERINIAKHSGPLGLFRIGFAIILFYQLSENIKRTAFYLQEEYLYIPYEGLSFIHFLPVSFLTLLVYIGMIASLFVLFGLFFRPFLILATTIFTYIFLLDSVYYNNHYYLIILIGILLSFTNADAKFSLSNNKSDQVPHWHYLILQIMLAIVFFYGGLAKCNADWLGGHVIKGITEEDWFNQVLIYGGWIFDLAIPFLLFFRKTRFMAILTVLIFNITNGLIFDDIGAFPILASLSMLCFIEGAWFPSMIQNKIQINKPETFIPKTKWVKIILVSFFAFQLLFPLRHYMISSHPEWSGQGHYFSWRMKSYTKDVELKVYAYDKVENMRLYPINTGIDNYTLQRIAAFPAMVPKIAQSVLNKIERLDGKKENIGISVDYMVSLNNRQVKRAIKSDIDITKVNYNWIRQNHWILPR